MSNHESNVSPRWPGFSSLYTWVAIIIFVLLVVLWLLGYGPGGSNCAIPTMAARSDIGAGAAPSAVEQREEMDMPVPEPARLHFEIESYELPADSLTTLQPILGYLKGHHGTTAIVSGYHDPSGDYEYNKQLSKDRAQAVRDLLMRHGIDEERIVLLKPRETTGTGPPEEARRVVVRVGNLE
jgi:hypothetical protein